MSDFRFNRKVEWDKNLEADEPQEYRCENCKKVISEDNYENNSGYCDECDYTYN